MCYSQKSETSILKRLKYILVISFPKKCTEYAKNTIPVFCNIYNSKLP